MKKSSWTRSTLLDLLALFLSPKIQERKTQADATAHEHRDCFRHISPTAIANLQPLFRVGIAAISLPFVPALHLSPSTSCPHARHLAIFLEDRCLRHDARNAHFIRISCQDDGSSSQPSLVPRATTTTTPM
ncbi:hypothetical protein C8J57DRAFT_1312098 [Mycena rebaudengoi]|nr:hypothetical protein C8J57DRAFT_1312098 [Mycena rebaudengoi]